MSGFLVGYGTFGRLTFFYRNSSEAFLSHGYSLSCLLQSLAGGSVHLLGLCPVDEALLDCSHHPVKCKRAHFSALCCAYHNPSQLCMVPSTDEERSVSLFREAGDPSCYCVFFCKMSSLLDKTSGSQPWLFLNCLGT